MSNPQKKDGTSQGHIDSAGGSISITMNNMADRRLSHPAHPNEATSKLKSVTRQSGGGSGVNSVAVTENKNVSVDKISSSGLSKTKLAGGKITTPAIIKRSRSNMGYNCTIPKLGSLPRMSEGEQQDRDKTRTIKAVKQRSVFGGGGHSPLITRSQRKQLRLIKDKYLDSQSRIAEACHQSLVVVDE